MIVVNVIVAILIFVVIVRAGMWAIGMIAHPTPPPPPEGELRRINAKFRCGVCGMEMRVMLAPDDDPEPPRHCMEEMEMLPARE
ncbi:MAG TPA: hypothetical protein VGI06_09180 [Acidimicrobiales bacterium]